MDIQVCDYCVNVAYDQGIQGYEEQATIMITMGSEVEDHLCDEVETVGEVRCACDCMTGYRG